MNELKTISQVNGLKETLEGKAAKTNLVSKSGSSVTQEIAPNTIYDCGELTALTITLPSTIEIDYISQINFTSCENDALTGNSTQFNPPQPPAPTIIMDGDDINAQGQFVPVENKRYTLMLYSDGSNVLGVVRGTDIPQQSQGE